MTQQDTKAVTLEEVNQQYNVTCAKLGDVNFKVLQIDRELDRLENLKDSLQIQANSLIESIDDLNALAGELQKPSKPLQASESRMANPEELEALKSLSEPSAVTKDREDFSDSEIEKGLQAISDLHQEMGEYVNPNAVRAEL